MFSNAAFAGAAVVDVSALLTQIYLSSRWKTEDAERLERRFFSRAETHLSFRKPSGVLVLQFFVLKRLLGSFRGRQGLK